MSSVTLASLLPIVDVCDNFRLASSDEEIVPFWLHRPGSTKEKQYPLGHLRPQIVSLLREDESNAWLDSTTIDGKAYVAFPIELDTSAKRTSAIDILVKKWIARGLFSEVTGGRLWRNEPYAVYNNPFGPLTEANVAFTVERSAAALFGVITYGVHMNMWLQQGEDAKDYKVWTPTRSLTKQTWGGYLDNSVAGGIPAGMSPLDAIVKECEEEASLPEELVRKLIKPVGTYL